MALCVRKLDSRRHWDAPRPEETWLGPDDLRADALADLKTEENRLSIFEIDEITGVSLDRILAALAAKRQHVNKLDFAVFDSAILAELGIAYERAPADTLDTAVNATHLDLIQLTASRVADLGARIRSGGELKRYPDKKVEGLIRESVQRGFVDPNGLHIDVAKRVLDAAR